MDTLSTLNKYQSFDKTLQDAFLRLANRRTMPKGTVLVNEGQIVNEVHFIQKGLIRGFYYQGKREITSWIADEGSFIWSLPSYLLKSPSRENIQLMETTTVLSLPRQAVEQLKHEYDIFDGLQCQIMERYIVLYDLRIQILLMRAEERFEAYQKLFPELYGRVPLRYIATYLGIDPATLSRLRSGFKTKN